MRSLANQNITGGNNESRSRLKLEASNPILSNNLSNQLRKFRKRSPVNNKGSNMSYFQFIEKQNCQTNNNAKKELKESYKDKENILNYNNPHSRDNITTNTNKEYFRDREREREERGSPYSKDYHKKRTNNPLRPDKAGPSENPTMVLVGNTNTTSSNLGGRLDFSFKQKQCVSTLSHKYPSQQHHLQTNANAIHANSQVSFTSKTSLDKYPGHTSNLHSNLNVLPTATTANSNSNASLGTGPNPNRGAKNRRQSVEAYSDKDKECGSSLRDKDNLGTQPNSDQSLDDSIELHLNELNVLAKLSSKLDSHIYKDNKRCVNYDIGKMYTENNSLSRKAEGLAQGMKKSSLSFVSLKSMLRCRSYDKY